MVPLEIYEIIGNLNQIRHKESIRDVVSSDLWPRKDSIINFERNYGDALSNEDMTGIKPKIKKVKRKMKSRRTTEN